MQKRYLRTIVSAALLVLLTGAGAGLVAFMSSGGKMMSIQSGSMEPALKKGGLVAVQEVDPGQINKGDIITYRNPADRTQTITHRVTGTMPAIMSGGRPYFITKGDANQAADQPVPASMVVGRVESHVPYAGYVIDQIRRPLGLIAVIYIPALIVIAFEIRRLAAYYRSIRPYKLYEHRPKDLGHAPLVLAIGVLSAALAVWTAIPVQAALRSSAALSGNTITSIPLAPPPAPQDPAEDKTISCANNTDININNRTSQRAESGDAQSSGNNSGGSATSGNASNSNSTSVNVEVNNTGCVDAPAD